jgi:chitodextrinase
MGSLIRKFGLLSVLVLTLATGWSSAPLIATASGPWSSVLPATRAIDWSSAGVQGGIPNRTVICTTLNPGATLAQINTAIANCPSGDVVFLNAGNYTLAGQLNLFKSNVTLRGAGPDQTFLSFTSGGDCNGQGGDICVMNSDNNYSGDPHNTATWTGPYTQGASSITLGSIGLGSINNLHVGSLLILDQNSDYPNDPGTIYVCDSVGCSQQGGIGCGRSNTNGTSGNRVENQEVIVTSISGSGPYTIGITPGIYAPNWRSNMSPGAWWSSAVPVSGVGIESLSVTHSGATNQNGSGIMFSNAANSWVQNIRSVNAGSNPKHKHVWEYQSSHITIRDSYFYGSNPTSEGYGVDMGCSSSDNLAENNIFQHIATALIGEDTAGSVMGYNYAADNYYNNGAPAWQQQDAYHHSAGDNYMLWEGQIGSGLALDDIHGSSFMLTAFRDRWSGRDPTLSGGQPKSESTIGAQIFAYNRYANLIGNVLGTTGYHTNYQESASTANDQGNGSLGDLSIFTLGYSGDEGTIYSGIPNDPLVASTIIRWGNYDTVNNAVRWVAGENGSTAPGYPGLSAPIQALPASFYLSGKPVWWGSTIPWPAIGPDVSGGNISSVGGHAYLTPSANCYLNVMGGKTDGTSGALTFNATTCYYSGGGVGDTTAPSTPIGLSASVTTTSTVSMSWTASTDNIGVTGYKVFRNSVQVGTPSGVSFTDSGLSAGTTYTYTVSAFDAAGNTSAQSSAIQATTQASVGGDTTPPTTSITAPANNATVSGTTSVTASASDNVGVSKVEFYLDNILQQTDTTSPYTWSWDTTTAINGTHTIQTKAYDAAGNVGVSVIATLNVSNVSGGGGGGTWTHVQTKSKNVSVNTNALAFTSANQVGDLIIAEVDWTGGGTFTSISDSQGNTYTQVGVEQNSAGVGVKSRLYYAKNIKAGANTVTTVVTGGPSFHELYIHEYSGLSTSAPLDGFSVSSGNGTSFTSNNVVTTQANDLLYGVEIDSGGATASAGWTTRSTLDGDVAADKNAATTGSYAFTGTSSGSFIAWEAAFGTASAGGGGGGGSDTTAPSVPSGLSVSGTTTSTASLSWAASTDNVGVTGYKVFRSGVQVGTPSSASFTDSGLSPATTYAYAVSAFDAAGNNSAQSTSVNATTASTADTTPPTTSVTSPTAGSTVSGTISASASASDNIGVSKVEFYLDGSLQQTDTTSPYTWSWNTTSATNASHVLSTKAYDAAGNIGSSANVSVTVNNVVADVTPPSIPIGFVSAGTTTSTVSLSWTASTDNVGVMGYKVYRCTGACVPAVQVGNVATPAFIDSGLTASITYSYAVAAYDAAGNTSALSTVLQVSTQFQDVTPPAIAITSPTNSQTISGTVNVTGAASDNIGVTSVKISIDNGVYAAATGLTSWSYSVNTSGLANGNHMITVQAADASLNTNTTSITVNVQNAAAAILQISNVATSSITNNGGAVSWNSNSPANSIVNYGTSQGQLTSSTTSSLFLTSHQIALSGLRKNTTYFAQALSTDNNGNVASSPIVSFTTLLKPPKVTGLSATSGSVILTWTNPATSTGTYASIEIVRRIDQFSNDPVADAQYVIATLTPTATTYHDANVDPATTYYYSVFTIDSTGTASDPTQIAFTTAGVPTPGGGTNSGSGSTGSTSGTGSGTGSTSGTGNTGGSVPTNTTDLAVLLQTLLAQLKALIAQLNHQLVSSFTRNLTIGSTGSDVKNLQMFLNDNGYTITTSGSGAPGSESIYFGAKTAAALARWQKDNGLPNTGFMGSLTRGKMVGKY